jgi:peptidoglycan hydrolase-like protein with peptidoglycan-binding domain
LRAKAIVVILALSAALALFAETPAQKGKTAAASKKASAKKSTAKSSKSAGKTTASAKKSSSSKSGPSKQTSSKQVASRYRRSAQKEPAPDRYKEIQQSLADKGYFGGPVNGAWGPDSVEALKRFQRDQNIGDDGKLGSLSLIALGLGPKRGSGGPEKPENPGAGLPPP